MSRLPYNSRTRRRPAARGRSHEPLCAARLMRILYSDTLTAYPLNVAGGHRCSHLMRRLLCERRGAECLAIVPRQALGAPPSPEYYPRLPDFEALGIRSFHQQKGRWSFDCGYPVEVVDDLWGALDAALREFRPDVFVTLSLEPEPFFERARACGVQAVYDIMDVRYMPERVRAAADSGVRILALSRFMAAWLRERAGVDAHVVYPLLLREEYEVERQAPGLISVINLFPEKGFDTFVEIARRLPEENFLAVESWPLGARLPGVRAQLAELPQVEFQPRLADVRDVYRRTRLLLVPSRYQESAGRVVVEAQWSGIPVLVSRRGGLPEMVGEGGLVVDSDDPAAWVAAIREVTGDARRYAELSQAARRNAARPDFDPERILDAFLRAVGHAP